VIPAPITVCRKGKASNGATAVTEPAAGRFKAEGNDGARTNRKRKAKDDSVELRWEERWTELRNIFQEISDLVKSSRSSKVRALAHSTAWSRYGD
jgi:hypothetical protein